jgi:hypothetical protein
MTAGKAPAPTPTPTEGGVGPDVCGCLCTTLKAIVLGIPSQSSSYLEHLRGCSLAIALDLL